MHLIDDTPKPRPRWLSWLLVITTVGLTVLAVRTAIGAEIEGPSQIPRDTMGRFKLIDVTDSSQAIWDVRPPGCDFEALENGRQFRVTGKPGIQYEIECIVVDFDARTLKRLRRPFVVDSLDPTPDPGPGPQPDPEPTPTPDPPMPGVKGLHVLIVYEQREMSTYDPGQRTVMNSSPLREWMDQNGVTCRVFDADTRLDASEDKVWVEAVKRPRGPLPWVILSNSKAGYEGPIPKGDPQAAIDEFKSLLTKYAEAK